MPVKTVLCYGDSNTWGYNPATKDRYDRESRWPGILRKALGNEYVVIEEGLNGRTTVWDDPIEGYKSGKEYLIPCLTSHKPLDLVIIMLGTNDLKKRFSLSAFDIAEGAGVLVDMTQRSDTGPNGQTPKVLLLAPPPVATLTDFADMFEGSEAKSKQIGQQYRRIAEEFGCNFFDTSNIIHSSNIDGIHLEKEEHQKLGTHLASLVQEILK